jgi:excinuclease ABC subunit C
VDGLFAGLAFSSLGPNRLSPWPGPDSLQCVRASRLGGLLSGVRLECPRRPGVYGMLDAAGELIYVGKAKSLRPRLLSYFRDRNQDARVRRILEQTRAVLWESLPSEFAALLRELELIRRWRPRCNVQGQPLRRRRWYVCVGRRPAPQVFLAARPPATAFASFGPVPAGRLAREAVRRVNDWFGLRDCPQPQEMIFADQAELFPVVRAAGCLRHEIGTCLGPCTGTGTHAAYEERVAAARAFLAGEDLALLQTLQRDMTAASEGQAFERAAVLRDKLEALGWLHEHLGLLREARRHSFVYPVAGLGGRDAWYVIEEGLVVAALPAPRDTSDRAAAEEAVRQIYQSNDIRKRALAAGEVDGVLLVASWFRRHPEELARTLPAPATAALARRPRAGRRATEAPLSTDRCSD